MLSAAKHLLYLFENKQKADPSCRLQRGLQVEIATSLRSAETRRGTNLESITCSNTTGVEFLPIMGSPKAVNAQDDMVGAFFSSLLD
jgi:hypothetical protein